MFEDSLTIEDIDVLQDIARSNFGDMLWDVERNLLFKKAIENRVLQLLRTIPKNETIRLLDIGAGTGLLSMFAAKAIQRFEPNRPHCILAFEKFRPTYECATKVLRINKFDHLIDLFNTFSNDHRWASEEEKQKNRVHLLFAELLDTELIGEGALAIYRSAVQNYLKKNALLIPTNARVYVQLITCPHLLKRTQLYDVEVQGHIRKAPHNMRNCPGAIRELHDIQLNELKDVMPLSRVGMAFEFNFRNIKSLENKKIQPISLKLLNEKCLEIVQKQEVMLAFWWDVKMDDQHILSCAPYWARYDVQYKNILKYPDQPVIYLDDELTSEEINARSNLAKRSIKEKLDSVNLFLEKLWSNHGSAMVYQMNILQRLVGRNLPWRDHWMQAIFHLPHNQEKLIRINNVTCVKILCFHDEYSFQFEYGERLDDFKGRNVCICGLHSSISQNRFQSLNNSKKCLEQTCSYIKKNVLPSENVIIFGDCSYMPFAVEAANQVKSVYIFTNKSNFSRCFYHNLLKSNKIHFQILDEFKALEQTINHVFWDGHFMTAYNAISSLLEYLQLLRKLRDTQPNIKVISYPAQVSIHFVPVCFDHLWKLRIPVNKIDGLDLEPYEHMINSAIETCDDLLEEHQLCDYSGICLANKSTVALKLNLNNQESLAQKMKEVNVINYQLLLDEIRYDFERKFGQPDKELINTKLDRLKPFRRHLNNISLCFWVQYENGWSNGPTKPLKYLEEIEWLRTQKQNVLFLDKLTPYNADQRDKMDVELKLQISETLFEISDFRTTF